MLKKVQELVLSCSKMIIPSSLVVLLNRVRMLVALNPTGANEHRPTRDRQNVPPTHLTPQSRILFSFWRDRQSVRVENARVVLPVMEDFAARLRNLATERNNECVACVHPCGVSITFPSLSLSR